jgi:hypothetical protein
MKKVASLLTCIVLTLALSAQTPAQEHRHEPANSVTQPAEKLPEHGSSMHGMKECMQRHQAAMTSVDQLTAMLENARSSDDPARMRVVIDQAHTQLAELKQNMAMCRAMMSMMEKMHEAHGMGGMMKGEKK